jgi:hypothetical protein
VAQLSMLRAGVFDWLESLASEQLSGEGVWIVGACVS